MLSSAIATLIGLLRQPQYLFRTIPNLTDRLYQAGITDSSYTPREESPVLFLRRFLTEEAPALNSFLLLVSKTGETTEKTNTLAEAFAEVIEAAPEFAERIWHLMCYAGRDNDGNPVLLNVPKPALTPESTSPLMFQTEEGHLVLNPEAAAKLLGAYTPLTEEEVAELTGGMEKHGVNFLTSMETYDRNPDLRVVFCESLVATYLNQESYRIQLVEVPLGPKGNNYSVVIPLETFIAFLTRMQQKVSHLEVSGYERLTEETLATTLAELRRLVARNELEQLLSYNSKRPLMAGFNAIVGQLSGALCKRAPNTPRDTAKAVMVNFVRHFFSVEHRLLTEALTAEESALTELYDKICQTEYGKYFVPCNDFEVFKTKIEEERQKKQPPVPFEFSEEVEKSDVYLALLDRMGSKLPYHLDAVGRKMMSSLPGTLRALEEQLLDDCRAKFPSAETASLESAVKDFVEIVFARHTAMFRVIQSKLRILRGEHNDTDDNATGAYYEQYWQEIEQMLQDLRQEEGVGIVPELREVCYGAILQAIQPDLILFRELPFVKRLGLEAFLDLPKFG